MPPRLGVSPWVGRRPGAGGPALQRFRGDASADVVVIGAGLTGCATALALATTRRRVVLLEGDRVGRGGTAVASGLLLSVPDPSFQRVAGDLGLRRAKLAFAGWQRAARDAAALLRREKIASGLISGDAFVATDHGGLRELERELALRQTAGHDVRWLTQTEASARLGTSLPGALRVGGAAWIDPYRTCLGLLAAGRRRGVLAYERSPVTQVRSSADGVEVRLATGTVRAGAVVVATGLPGRLYPGLRRHFLDQDATLVLTEKPAVAARKATAGIELTVRTLSGRLHEIVRLSDGRLLVVGAEQEAVPTRAQDRHIREWTFELMYELLKAYPAISGLPPAFGWLGRRAVARDGLPYVGTHRNYPHHFFALGTLGHSMTGAFLAARLLTRAVQGEPAPGDDAFGFRR